MKLAGIVESLALKAVAPEHGLDNEVTGGYVGDLLSRVMAKARAGDIWVTVQSHQNVIAVASLVGLSAVVIAEGVAVDSATMQKAREERIPVCTTTKTAFEVVAGLVKLGILSAG